MSSQLSATHANPFAQLSESIPPHLWERIDQVLDESLNGSSSPMAPHSGPQEGDPAPDFVLSDHLGQSHHLDELTAKGPVLLYFDRGTWNPFCGAFLRSLHRDVTKLEACKATVVAVLAEPRESLQQGKLAHDLPFVMLSDDGAVARKYGVEHRLDPRVQSAFAEAGYPASVVASDDGAQQATSVRPSVFLIGSDRRMRWVTFATRETNRPDVPEVLSVLDKLAAESEGWS